MNLLATFQIFQFTFDTKVSLQSILTIFMWVVTVVIFMTKVRSDIKIFQEWGTAHQAHSNKQDEEIQHLSIISERLTVLVENITERVSRVENTCERRHNPRD
jgi:hypothetical protein